MTIFVSLTKKPQKAFLEPYSWQPPSVIKPRASPFDVTSSCSIVHIPILCMYEFIFNFIDKKLKLPEKCHRGVPFSFNRNPFQTDRDVGR